MKFKITFWQDHWKKWADFLKTVLKYSEAFPVVIMVFSKTELNVSFDTKLEFEDTFSSYITNYLISSEWWPGHKRTSDNALDPNRKQIRLRVLTYMNYKFIKFANANTVIEIRNYRDNRRKNADYYKENDMKIPKVCLRITEVENWNASDNEWAIGKVNTTFTNIGVYVLKNPVIIKNLDWDNTICSFSYDFQQFVFLLNLSSTIDENYMKLIFSTEEDQLGLYISLNSCSSYWEIDKENANENNLPKKHLYIIDPSFSRESFNKQLEKNEFPMFIMSDNYLRVCIYGYDKQMKKEDQEEINNRDYLYEYSFNIPVIRKEMDEVDTL